MLQVSSALFKPIMGGNTSTADFLEFIEDVKSLETRRTVDVDEFMWIAMRVSARAASREVSDANIYYTYARATGCGSDQHFRKEF